MKAAPYYRLHAFTCTLPQLENVYLNQLKNLFEIPDLWNLVCTKLRSWYIVAFHLSLRGNVQLKTDNVNLCVYAKRERKKYNINLCMYAKRERKKLEKEREKRKDNKQKEKEKERKQNKTKKITKN